MDEKITLIPIKKFIETENKETIDTKVEIIKSDKVGVGKSTYIQMEIAKSRRKYIYFPLGREFTNKI